MATFKVTIRDDQMAILRDEGGTYWNESISDELLIEDAIIHFNPDRDMEEGAVTVTRIEEDHTLLKEGGKDGE